MTERNRGEILKFRLKWTWFRNRKISKGNYLVVLIPGQVKGKEGTYYLLQLAENGKTIYGERSYVENSRLCNKIDEINLDGKPISTVEQLLEDFPNLKKYTINP